MGGPKEVTEGSDHVHGAAGTLGLKLLNSFSSKACKFLLEVYAEFYDTLRLDNSYITDVS